MSFYASRLPLQYKFTIGIAINISFTLFEFIIGIASGSLALISDASHNLTDVISLLLSFFAHKMAQRKPTAANTYGYGRITILAALINSCILGMVAAYLFHESYHRFMQPQPIQSGTVMIIGLLGVIINGGVALTFAQYRHDVNIRSAFLNMLCDALASAGALAAGCISWLTHTTLVDPLASIAIGCMLAHNAWYLTKDAFHLLLDGVPASLTIDQVKDHITRIPLVKAVEDLHIWALSSQHIALSCHIIINTDSLDQSMTLIDTIKQDLHRTFTITHATLELKLHKASANSCPIN